MENETAWLPPELNPVALRLARADHAAFQMGELALHWSRGTADPGPFELIQVERRAGELDLIISDIRPIPPLISMLFSEAIHHLRAAIDNTLFYLVEAARGEAISGPQARDIAMPIYAQRKKFTDWQKQKLKKGLLEFSAENRIGRRIETLQPYVDVTATVPSINPQLAALMGVRPKFAHPMLLLQRYSNDDKHRTIQMAAARANFQRSDEAFASSDRSMRPFRVGDVLTTGRRGSPVLVETVAAVHVLREESATWVAPGAELHHLHRYVSDVVIPTLVTGFALTRSLPAEIDLGDTGQTAAERIQAASWMPAHERMAEIAKQAYMEGLSNEPQLLPIARSSEHEGT